MNSTNQVSEKQAASAAVAKLQAVMVSAGWEIAHIDLDLTGAQPKAEIKVVRNDGRWVLARVDQLGRSTAERFQRETTLGMSANTRGRRPLSPQINDVFLGRTNYPGARSMLRDLTQYITNNASRPVLLADMRSAWASIMAAPLRIEGGAA